MTFSSQLPTSSGQTLGSAVNLLLQRGGEELPLEKMTDRFTVQLATPEVIEPLARQLNAQSYQSIAVAQSVEMVVAAGQCDLAMQQARNTPGVRFVSHVYALKNSPSSLVYFTNQLTIQFAPGIVPPQREQLTTGLGLRLLRDIAGLDATYLYEVTPAATLNPLKIANFLMSRPEVLAAEPNIVILAQHHYRPTDPLYPRQWYLHNNGGSQLSVTSHISAEAAWDITRGQRSIVVAIIDDSFDLNHPDLQGPGKIVSPLDLKENDLIPVPSGAEPSHGTACAGLAIAEENHFGMVGVAPGCGFMPIRTTGFLDDETIEKAFDWAMSHGASVISCSWGPSAVYFPLSLRQKAALTRAATTGRGGKGCVIVFAAGNANRPINGTVPESNWPNNALRGPTHWLTGFAAHPDVIAVSACTSLGKKAAYSNWGTQVAVCAPSNNAPPSMWLQQTGSVSTPPVLNPPLPGLGMLTIDQVGTAGYTSNDFTADFGGTSSACPIVAGVAALMLSVNPNLTSSEVREILQQTTDKIVDPDADAQFGYRYGTYEVHGHSQWFGYGRVNAFKAVQAARSRLTAIVPRQIQQRNETELAIPDYSLQGVTSSIQINDHGTIRDLQVTVEVNHTFLGDLSLSLLSPNGQAILLQGRTLGRRTSLKTTYTVQTTPKLQDLISQPCQGTWRLLLVDGVPHDTGTLKFWQLTLQI